MKTNAKKSINPSLIAIFAVFGWFFSAAVFAESSVANNQTATEQAGTAQTSEQQLQTLKADLVDIAADLQMLEEQMLYPDAEQVAIYLSVDSAEQFNVTGVKLLINKQLVNENSYNEVQTAAFNRGGIERLYLGELAPGEHEVTAYISGKDLQGNKLKRAISILITKAAAANVVELHIGYGQQSMQAKFSAVEL